MTSRHAGPAATIVSMTAAATAKLEELLVRGGRPGLLLRVSVAPGGCSGFSYGMELTDHAREDDIVVAIGGVRVVVDEASSRHLQGSEIDFVDGLMRAGFTIHNPNATAGCACGHSFRTPDAKGQPSPCTH